MLLKRLASLLGGMACALLWAPAKVEAQLNSTTSTVTINATLPEVLTVTASPAVVAMTLVPGQASTTSTPVAINTAWTLKSTRAAVVVYGWFASPSGALSDGAATPNLIPASAVYGQMASGMPTTYTAFTQSNTLGSASGGLELFSQTLSSANRTGSRSDNMYYKIDLTNLAQLPAGLYTGVLTLQAQAL